MLAAMRNSASALMVSTGVYCSNSDTPPAGMTIARNRVKRDWPNQSQADIQVNCAKQGRQQGAGVQVQKPQTRQMTDARQGNQGRRSVAQ